MKTCKTLRLPATLSALVLFALVGCADRDRPTVATAETPTPPAKTAGETVGDAWDKTKDTAKDVYADAKSATMDGVEKLERATYDERAELKANLSKAGADIENKFAEWNRDGKTISPRAKTKLAEARARFDDSVDALGSATADGWAAAKAKTATAWAELKSAYAEARAEHA